MIAARRRLIAAGLVCLLSPSAACRRQAEASDEEEARATNTLLSGEVPRAARWKRTTIVRGLVHPWALAFLPGGEILVTERPGRLRMVRDGALVSSPVEGAPEVFASGQGGLLDVVVHPDFEKNHLVYLTYSAGDEERNRTTLARGRLDGARLRDVEVLFQAHPEKSGSQHFGSRLLWLADGSLLMSVGDGGNPPLEVEGVLARDLAQRLDTHLGSILRLDENGRAPRNNPFTGRPGVRPEIYAYGVRNVQGLALDRATGRVWANEHGPLGGDELNLIRRGENYGWPKATYGADYRTGKRFTPHRTLPGTMSPKVAWKGRQAPSGLAFYTGKRLPGWQGSLFSGFLVGQEIRRSILQDDRVTAEESLPIGSRVRAVVQGPDDLLYVLTDEENGELIRIDPG